MELYISFCKLIVVVQHVHSFVLVTESSRIVLVSVQAKRYAQWGTVIVIYYRGQSGDRNATRL